MRTLKPAASANLSQHVLIKHTLATNLIMCLFPPVLTKHMILKSLLATCLMIVLLIRFLFPLAAVSTWTLALAVTVLLHTVVSATLFQHVLTMYTMKNSLASHLLLALLKHMLAKHLLLTSLVLLIRFLFPHAAVRAWRLALAVAVLLHTIYMIVNALFPNGIVKHSLATNLIVALFCLFPLVLTKHMLVTSLMQVLLFRFLFPHAAVRTWRLALALAVLMHTVYMIDLIALFPNVVTTHLQVSACLATDLIFALFSFFPLVLTKPMLVASLMQIRTCIKQKMTSSIPMFGFMQLQIKPGLSILIFHM